MVTVSVVLVLLLLLTSGGGEEVYQAAPYQFQYGVTDPHHQTVFGHQESQDARGHRRGRYYVALPDGRLQTVEYQVEGERGYLAQVTYQGQPSQPPARQEIAAQALVAQVHHTQHQHLSQEISGSSGVEQHQGQEEE